MCIFTGSIEHVSATHIFARRVDGQQVVAYEMNLSTPTETAMVLPVPVLRGTGEDALRFINLERYTSFFDDLDELFAPEREHFYGADYDGPMEVLEMLEVHNVGSFEASYVPTAADFQRLDPRFRLPPGIWDSLPAINDYGFAVFKLAAGKEARIHPMAFTFPTRWPDKIVFPTIHVHDGSVHETAQFDHRLFCQLGDVDADLDPNTTLTPSLGEWRRSTMLVEHKVDVARAGELVDGQSRCYRLIMNGSFRNEDVVLTGGRPDGRSGLLG